MAEVRMPKMGDGMEEGTILRWLKREGDMVAVDESIAEIETDKANVEIPAEEAGPLIRIVAAEGETLAIGSVIAYIGAVPDEAPPSAPQPERAPATPTETGSAAPEAEAAPTTVSAADGGRIRATPLARSMARRLGVDLGKIRGTGGGVGRIVGKDVAAFAAAQPTEGTAKPSVRAEQTAVDIPLSRMRKAIARRTVLSKQTAPHFYLVIPVDMDRAVDTLDQLNAQAPDRKITVNDLVVKACAAALAIHPDVNVSYTEGETLRQHAAINIGIAVGTDEGLRIPVITDCAERSLRDLSDAARTLVGRTRRGELTPQEMSGATFTVSNLGMFGIEEFAAIISPPEAAILAVGAIAPEVQPGEHGSLVVRKRMRLTLSCDHRAVDGLLGARFLQTLKGLLEHPVALLTT